MTKIAIYENFGKQLYKEVSVLAWRFHNFYMINKPEREINHAHKRYKIVGILTFISVINTTFESLKTT